MPRDSLSTPVFDAFTEGVKSGGLRSKSEIQLLICAMMEALDNPVSVRLISDTCQKEELANYFEVQNALSELVEKGILQPELADGEEFIELTGEGEAAASVLQEDLPKSVLQTAIRSAKRQQLLERNAKDNKVRIEAYRDGFHVSFSMVERETELLSLTVFVTDRKEAEALKEKFLENPVKIYSSILTGLMIN
ncbi:MAG TPA: DUF4364 family protein [Clostridiales bacterium]|nr:DUF4364 family protein [Clostridiales bacterium]